MPPRKKAAAPAESPAETPAGAPQRLPPPGAEDVLYLVDLAGYVFRAYHAIAPLTSPSGEPTHAVFGTVGMLARLVGERRPAYLAVAMDGASKTFRDEIDANYKANRPPPPPDLPSQMERCREIVLAYNIPTFLCEGLEADDLIATAVDRALEKNLRVVIASSDKDLMQLVEDGRVMLWDAMRDKVYGEAEVEEKFGVRPPLIRDLLALVGDTSDNVPGVPGVGPKTAAELLRAYGSLEGVYEHVGEIKKPKLKENLQNHEADARMSQRLVTLRRDCEVDLDLETLRYGGADVERLREIFTELGFTRMLKSLPASPGVSDASDASGAGSPGAAAPKSAGPLSRLLASEAELEAFAAEARAEGRLALEAHATSRETTFARLVGLGLAQPGASAYVPLGHRDLGAAEQVSGEALVRALGPLLEEPAFPKVGHDLKFSDVLLRREGIRLQGVAFDSMLATYLLDPERPNDLASLAREELSETLPALEAKPAKRGSKKREADEIPIDETREAASALPRAALALEAKLAPRLEAAELSGLLRDLELPLASLLAGMEARGVLVDTAQLGTMAREMAAALESLEKRAKELVGDVNLASPKQLEAVLFDQLGLKATKRTKTGRSTDVESLESLLGEHPLPEIVLEHRMIAKLKGTYVDALPKLIHPTTGRIHTRWGQAVAATGRLSSQDPNLQNVPIRTPLGKTIRRAFVAPPGALILSADYSQIELRLLAHLSKDPLLVESFQKGEDVHVRTAMEIFGVAAADVTGEMRRRSKTINFGVIYGMGEVALGKRLGIPRAEAAAFIEAYFARYGGVRAFMERTLHEARKAGLVRTLLGRRRLLPDLHSADGQRRAQAERIAQNTPIQGTAADILKLAMVRLAEPVVPGASMVLTVHDELIFEVPEASAAEAAEKVKRAMESAMILEVPLVVEVGWGKSWADAH